jgi:ClpP class serine protease
MKQLPTLSGQIYCIPWAILPTVHADLGQMYRSYLSGALVPTGLDQQGHKSSGISYEVDHVSGIAVITLEGIVAKHSPDILCGPPIMDLAKVDALIEELLGDAAIETVVFYFNSPGGCMIGLKETALNIRELAMEKRVVAYCDYQCCSAAYYLAAACDEIYAAPTAMLGSIGTYLAALDSSRAWEMEGFELKLFKVGEVKAAGHPGKVWTKAEEEYLQGLADKAGADFRGWVKSRRPGVEDASMEGQVFFAEDAPRGLIDGQFRDCSRLVAMLMLAA